MRLIASALLALTMTLAALAQPVESFDSFITGFRSKAVAAGVSGRLYDRVMGGLTPNPRVPGLVTAQPEFTAPVWDYVEGGRPQVASREARRPLLAITRCSPRSAMPMGWILTCSVRSGAWKPIMARCWVMPG